MKKTMILALTIMLLATSAMGFAEAVPTTTNVEGVLNRSISFSDRNPDGSFPMNPEIDKESPTTGLPTENSEYLPILVQIDNNLGALPQWGIADADIMYEAPIQGGGWTRMTALFSDVYPEEA
ncbi:MAG: DUF3048 domain-containing protein, partial [Clostridiales bacterium]|nr:DUF3048 domain-containing protein [Clostridiales bacterium]